MAKELLTDARIRRAKPKDKPYRLADGGRLYLYVATSGVMSWQLRYRFEGKPQTATLGKYPTISLADARSKADDLRKLDGQHLTEAKRAAKVMRRAARANTFGLIAAGWVARESRRQQWSPGYRREVEASIDNHLSDLAALPIAKITAPLVAPVLAEIEAKAPLMIEKVRPRLHAILDYATELGAILGNPLPVTQRKKKQRARRHFPAVVDLQGVGEILRAARSADPCKGVQRAHLLLVFTAQRVSEVVGAQWSEFNLDAGLWRIPRSRMKQKDAERGPHEIPLPPRLLALLREWRIADGDASPFVCGAPRNAKKPIVPEAAEKFYRNALQLGGKHSPHSWRSAFSTICRDAGKDGDTIEAQLDHVVGNNVQAAYDRAKRLELRRGLLRWYEAQLIAARDGAAVRQFLGREVRAGTGQLR
jgi:integrase